ncbi:hypothetical protein HK101_003891 [Irineochytrium annulatum]|nr:hypothetical protein HK101_003891 [Irineochytrium annulatum]
MADRKAFLMSGSVVESAASYVSASTRRADRAHLKMSADEMDVAVGDVIVVVETFEDDWAEGYNVTSKASGRFPCVVLGEGEALSGMLATDAGPPSNWISLASIEVKEYELDGKLQANLISTKSYLLERQRVIRGIV